MLSLRLILPGSQHYWRLLSAATGVGSHPSLWCDTWGPTFPLCPKESSIQQSPHHSQPSVKGQDPSCPRCPAAELHLTGSRDAWYLHKLQRAHAVLVRPFFASFPNREAGHCIWHHQARRFFSQVVCERLYWLMRFSLRTRQTDALGLSEGARISEVRKLNISNW